MQTQENLKNNTKKGLDLFQVIPYQYKYLNQFYDDLPDNVYLNKSLVGCGGTTTCIDNDVPYVILVPYSEIIKNKCEKHNNLIGVLKGVTTKHIQDQLLQRDVIDVTPKIMTTWDSFPKVMRALDDKIKDFKVCIDEAHNLINQAELKPRVIDFVLNNFRKFKSFVFITATPNDRDLIPDCLYDVDFLRLDWECAVKVKLETQIIQSSKCNDYVLEICKRHLTGGIEGNAYIFYNSVSEIISVVKKLKNLDGFNAENVNIFVSEKAENTKKIRTQLGVRFLGGSFNDNKKINLLSSSKFEGCDIMDENGRSYSIISNRRNSTKQSGDILVCQIAGRLRVSKYKNTLTMLICGFSEYADLSIDDFHQLLEKQITESKAYLELYHEQVRLGNESNVAKILDGSINDKFLFVDEDGELKFNEYAYKYEKQVYKTIHWDYFTSNLNSGDNSLDKNAKMYRTPIENEIQVSDLTRLLIDTKVDYRRVMKIYLEAIHNNDTSVIELIDEKSPEHKYHYDTVGEATIKSLSYNKTKIKHAVAVAENFNENYLNVISNLGLRLNTKYTCHELKSKIQQVYSELGIAKTAKATDVKLYYSVRQCYKDRRDAFEILGHKTEALVNED